MMCMSGIKSLLLTVVLLVAVPDNFLFRPFAVGSGGRGGGLFLGYGLTTSREVNPDHEREVGKKARGQLERFL